MLIIALGVLVIARMYYVNIITMLFPDVDLGGVLPSVLLGMGLFVLVSVCNIIAIRRKIVSIWNRKE